MILPRPTQIYTLSLHDALPISGTVLGEFALADGSALRVGTVEWLTPQGRRIWHEGIVPDVVVERADDVRPVVPDDVRSEEHTSELQSQSNLVCRLLLEKKKKSW